MHMTTTGQNWDYETYPPILGRKKESIQNKTKQCLSFQRTVNGSLRAFEANEMTKGYTSTPP